MSFKDLNVKELRAAAEYFGVDSKEAPAVILADLFAEGVTWEQYEDAFLKRDSKDAEKKDAPSSDKAIQTENKDVPTAPEEPVVVDEPVRIVTAERNPVLKEEKYLVRMTRDNPYFEYKNYKFTTENPYVIMPREDAQAILSEETGFRQAFPDELDEFYS